MYLMLLLSYDHTDRMYSTFFLLLPRSRRTCVRWQFRCVWHRIKLMCFPFKVSLLLSSVKEAPQAWFEYTETKLQLFTLISCFCLCPADDQKNKRLHLNQEKKTLQTSTISPLSLGYPVNLAVTGLLLTDSLATWTQKGSTRRWQM